VVRNLRSSLRATSEYLALAIDRLELACRPSATLTLDGVPADPIVQLAAASEAFQCAADRLLTHLDHGYAVRADAIAEMIRDRASIIGDETERT
jgi:hypothetical protein